MVSVYKKAYNYRLSYVSALRGMLSLVTIFLMLIFQSHRGLSVVGAARLAQKPEVEGC